MGEALGFAESMPNTYWYYFGSNQKLFRADLLDDLAIQIILNFFELSASPTLLYLGSLGCFSNQSCSPRAKLQQWRNSFHAYSPFS